jgi:hypothetical protein
VARALDEVLALWREGERLLEELPPDSPDRRPVQVHVYQLRRIYRRLTDTRIPRTAEHMATSLEAVERARATLASAQARLGSGEPGEVPRQPATLLAEPET